MRMVQIKRRARECHWRVYLVGWHWQTPRWALSMDLQVCWAECCTRRMEHFVRACCPSLWKQISKRCKHVNRNILPGEKDATARDAVRWTTELVDTLRIPGLSTYGMNERIFPEAVEKTMKANSFKGNPIALSEEELRRILEKAL